MFVRTLILILVLFILQNPTGQPRVNRIYVTTPYNASIIYEYANSSIHEGEPLNHSTLDCVASQLRATGLFSDIQITLRPVATSQVDIDIVPVWSDSKDNFNIDEITIEGFTVPDGKELLNRLEKKGLKQGTPVLKYPLPQIRRMVTDSVREIYRNDPETMYGAEEQISDLSFRLTLTSAHSIKFVMTTIASPVCAGK